MALDPEEHVALLLRDLRASRTGLPSLEAQRRLGQYGPNELSRRGGRRWPRELARQFTHPLALLLWAAALLAWLAGIVAVALAIVVVIVINAVFAFIQEAQAERAVEALAQFLPARAKVLRDGAERTIAARELVPGDVLVLEEGDRISADARLLDGTIEVDMSMLTGESVPVLRSAEQLDTRVPLLAAHELVLSGTACTEGDARALVFATGMHTEIGRIAALSERVSAEESPLEAQVRRVAWLIAADRGRDGDRVHADRDARRRPVVHRLDRLRGRPAGRQRARGAAAGDHAGAGGRRARAGAQGGRGQAARAPWRRSAPPT